MADAQPDFISQLRALNPDAGLDQYDDQTLASLVADQHPDYKPRLQQYLHPTAAAASQSLAQQGAPPASSIDPEHFEPDNPYLRGAQHVAQGLTSPTSLALMAGTAALAPVAPVAAATVGGAFVAKQSWDTIKSIPELYRHLKAGLAGNQDEMDTFKEKATEAGLGGALLGLGLFGHGASETVAEPKMVPDEAATAAAKTAGKAAEAVKDIPGASEAAEAQKAAQEAAAEQSQVPDQMRPQESQEPEGPPIVKGTKPVQTSSGPVQPNPPAIDEVRDELRDSLKAKGVDPDDPQAQANLYAKWYGLSKPINIASVGDVPVSESSDAGTHYDFDLAKNDPTMVAHELQHARQNEGQIPEVPEGPGANDAISGQVANDLQPVAGLNPDWYSLSPGAKEELLQGSQQVVKGPPVTWEETVSNGSALGLSLDDSTALAKGSKDWPSLVANLKAQVTQAANNMDIAKSTGHEGLVMGAVDDWLAKFGNASEVASNSARALNAQKIKINPEGGLSQDTIDRLDEVAGKIRELQAAGNSDQALEAKRKVAALNLKDPEQVANLSSALGTKGAPWWQQIGYVFQNALIANLPTMEIKAGSDIAAALMSVPRTALGSTLNRALYAVRGIGDEPHPIAETQARVAGMFSAVHDAILGFNKTLKTGSTVYTRRPPIGGAAGFWIGTPSRAFGAITDAATVFGMKGELYETGIRDALNSGLTGSDAMQAARNYANTAPAEALSAARAELAGEEITPEQQRTVKQVKSAQKETSVDTLTQPPGNITGKVISVRQALPGAALEAPFILTPTNLVKAALGDYLGGFAGIAKDIYQGNEISNAKMGRATLGGMLWAWGYQLAKAGKITGAGPTDRKEFSDLYNGGWRPESVMVTGAGYPNGFTSLRALGPLGYALGSIADVVEIENEATRTPPGLETYANMTADHMFRFALEQPMLQGLDNFIKTLNGEHPIGAAAGGILGGFVPGQVARAAQAMDDYQRKIDSFGSALKARLPFYRQTLEPKRDWEGNALPETSTPTERMVGQPRSEPSPDWLGLIAQDANIPKFPTKLWIPVKMGGRVQKMPVPLKDDDLDTYERTAGEFLKPATDALRAAPSRFQGLSADVQSKYLRDVVEYARGAAAEAMVGYLKNRGTLDDYANGAAGRAGGKAQFNPYNQTMYRPGSDAAQAAMARFHVVPSEMPSRVPLELAPEYAQELSKARAIAFATYTRNPSQLGSVPFEQAQTAIEAMDKAATDQAVSETLRRAKALQGVKSQPEAGQ